MKPPGEIAAPAAPAAVLVGRDAEQASIGAIMARARGELSGVLVVEGEAGVGKTALLDAAVDGAVRMTVLRVDGMESEMELPFAALHRLLRPLQHRPDALAAPQRLALDTAFGRVPGAPPAPVMIGLATLSLLADAGADRPLLCVVDDAQWIDAPSLEALGFVGRRLMADRVALLFAIRDGPDTPPALEGLTRLRLEGLTAASAEQLLVPWGLDRATVSRLVEQTGGNALGLMELASHSAWATVDRMGVARAELPPRLEALFARQVRALPEDTQTFLLLAAAEPACHIDTLLRAATQLGVGIEASAAAEEKRLLTITDRATFRHPLIRAAVYASAVESERRRIHRALAESIDEQEPDRRAWHRAIAAVGPDDAAADELERSARRARARGGYATESVILERAARLTSDPHRRALRLLQAARIACARGDGFRAEALLDDTTPLLDTPLLRAHAQLLRGSALPLVGRFPEAASVLADAARQLEPLDVRLAGDTWAEALWVSLVAQDKSRGLTLEEVARGALAAPVVPTPTLADHAMVALARRVIEGHREAATGLRDTISAFVSEDDPPPTGQALQLFAYLAADDCWDYEGKAAINDRLDRIDRARLGAGSIFVRSALLGQANVAWQGGNPDAAEAFYDEAAEIALTLNFPIARTDRVSWLAWQGAESETLSAVQHAREVDAARLGAGLAGHHAQLALGVLHQAYGRYEAALESLRPVFASDPIPYGSMILPELVEAAWRSGDSETAKAANARLSERAVASGTPWALSLRARCAALLEDADKADRLYQEALDLIGHTRVKTDLARAHLLYGEFLRRQRRRIEARDQLRLAHQQFTAMRCAGFAERARLELLATGERARVRVVETTDQLTPREAQIARLASQRATNGEIAARLFISESTVAYHLRKIFRKLAITSRRELADAMVSTHEDAR